jgi:hypothetical protein
MRRLVPRRGPFAPAIVCTAQRSDIGDYVPMFRGPDWNRIRAAVTAQLDPEERLVTLFTALNPSAGIGRGGS